MAMQEKTVKTVKAIQNRVDKGAPIKDAAKAEGRSSNWFYSTRYQMRKDAKPKASKPKRKQAKVIVTDLPAPRASMAFMFVGTPQALLELSKAMQ